MQTKKNNVNRFIARLLWAHDGKSNAATPQLATGSGHSIGLQADGTVVAIGGPDYGHCDVSSWANIVQVAGGGDHTVGLRSDGTVVAVGTNEYGERDISTWTDIVQVAAQKGYAASFTLCLKTDGTVVTFGSNDYGQCDVSSWTGIVQVFAGGNHSVGLKRMAPWLPWGAMMSGCAMLAHGPEFRR